MLLPKPVEEARNLRKEGNFVEALRVLESFLATLKPNQRAEKIACLNEQSHCLWRTGHYVDAEARAQEALTLANQSQTNIFGQGEALSNLGNIYRAMGKLSQAEDFEQRSLSLREELGNPEDIAASLNNLGSIYWQKGELDRAEEFYRRSLSIRETLGKPHDIASTLNNLGLVYLWLGKLDHSEKIYKRALTLFERAGNPQDIAKCLNNLGLLYQQQGKLDLAEKAFQRALNLGEQLGNLQDVARYLNNLGITYSQQGRFDNAEEYLLQSYTLKKKIGNPLDIATSLINLGEVCVQRGDLNRAAEYYHQILALKEQLTNFGIIAMTFNNLGVVYWQQGQLEQAEEVLQQALVIREEIGNPRDIASSRYQLIRVMLSSGSLERAAAESDRLVQLVHDSEHPETAVRHSLVTSLLKFHQGNLREALTLAQQARIQAEEIPHFGLTIDAMQLLIQILLQLYLFGEEEEHKTQCETLVQELEQLSKRERLHGIYVQSILVQGLLKRATFHLQEAAGLFERAELLAEERGIHPVALQAHKELNKLHKQVAKLQKLQQAAPKSYDQKQLEEIITYIQKMQKLVKD
ncbi:MAG: tetratricopeptide repeat protein [Candidatus Hodarchaeota archaeon]